MYKNIPNNIKRDQYHILLLRAKKNAAEGLSAHEFEKPFADPEYARTHLSPEDFEVYEACRPFVRNGEANE